MAKSIRVVIMEGDESWIQATLENSFCDGKTEHIFGQGENGEKRTITVVTLHGEINTTGKNSDCMATY